LRRRIIAGLMVSKLCSCFQVRKRPKDSRISRNLVRLIDSENLHGTDGVKITQDHILRNLYGDLSVHEELSCHPCASSSIDECVPKYCQWVLCWAIGLELCANIRNENIQLGLCWLRCMEEKAKSGTTHGYLVSLAASFYFSKVAMLI
jgi:hypothetical protein